MMEAKRQLTSIVGRLRDMLRSENTPSITGEASVMHIIAYLIARACTSDVCTKLNINQNASWDQIMQRIEHNTEPEALCDFYTERDRTCLVNRIVTIFGYRALPIETDLHLNRSIRGAVQQTDPTKARIEPTNVYLHTRICKMINSLDIRFIGHELDIIGEVWEDYIRTSGNSRDNGQFFTDRRVVHYMLDTLINPQLKSDGTPPSICDPAMGTGGFLSQYIKYFQKEPYNIDWTQYLDRIVGHDIHQFTAANARANLFLQTGELFTNVLCKNSFTDPLPHDNYDVILANPPFGIKGAGKLLLTPKIKALGIQKGTCAELLFLQLIMAHLAPGGKAAVIMPDGALSNNTKQHVATRQYLLDHFEVKKIIKMDGGFFMNTSIKPSIIYFENTGFRTSVVPFYSIKEDLRNVDNVIEQHLKDVLVEDLDDGYVLLSTMYTVLDRLPVTGYPTIKLRDLITLREGSTISDEQLQGTTYYVMGAGLETNRKTDVYNRSGITFKIALRGGLSLNTCVSRHSRPFYLTNLGASLHTLDESMCKTDYVGYYLLLNKELVYDRTLGATSQRTLNYDMFYNIRIPVPPIDVQRHIVERFDRMINEKERLVLSMQENDLYVRMCYDRYFDEHEVFRVRLGDMINIEFGVRYKSSDNASIVYPVYGGGNISNYYDVYNRDGITFKVSRDGVSEHNCVVRLVGKYYLNDSGFTIHSMDEFNYMTAYIGYYLLLNKSYIYSISRGTAQKHINISKFLDMMIPMIPIEAQRQCVDECDNIMIMKEYQQHMHDQIEPCLIRYLKQQLGITSFDCPNDQPTLDDGAASDDTPTDDHLYERKEDDAQHTDDVVESAHTEPFIEQDGEHIVSAPSAGAAAAAAAAAVTTRKPRTRRV